MPSISRASAEVTGASSPARSIAWASRRHGLERLDGLADAIRDLRPRARPAASSSPALRLRDRRQRGGHEVAGAGAARRTSRALAAAARGQREHLEEDVGRRHAGGVQALRLGGARRPRAAAFFATPASSTPTGSSETSHTTPARWNASATRWASASERERAHQARRRTRTISRACAGPPTQATRSAPNTASSATVGGVPSGGTSPFASETMPARARDARGAQLLRAPRRARATARRAKIRSARGELVVGGAERAHLQLARQLDARAGSARSRASSSSSRGLLRGAAEQRGAHAGALEQHGDGGAEGAGADYRGAADGMRRAQDAGDARCSD